MLFAVIAALYYLLPAYIANMAPVIAARLEFFPRLAVPIDQGMTFRGSRLAGESKTWRGMVVGIAAAMFVGIVQFFLWHFNIIRLVSVIDFSVVDPIAFGFLGGVGALTGDLVKSVVKRRFNIPSGNPWPVFDQLDFVIGYVIATSVIVGVKPWLIGTALLLTLVLHPLVNIVAYLLTFKKVWW